MEPPPTPLVEGTSKDRALLEVPNDPELIKLILQGRNPKDRSGDLFFLSRKLGELNISAGSIATILQYADERWGKFLGREDRQERLQSLVGAAEEVRPTEFLDSIRPLRPSELASEAKEVDWLIEGVLATQTYGLITGSTGVGKSQLGIQMGMSLAKGSNWLQWACRKSRVLYASLEMGVNELGYFNEKLSNGMALDEDEDVFHYLPIGQPLSLLTEEGRQFYLQFLDDYDVFIFDTVSSSTHLSMLDDATAPGIVAFFTKLNQTHGKTVIALGHDVKSIKDNRAESMYGNRLLMDKSSMILRVDKAGDGLMLSFPKVRLAREPEPMTYDRDPETLWLSGGLTASTKVTIEKKKLKSNEIDKDDLFG
jgi:hypothetical protein